MRSLRHVFEVHAYSGTEEVLIQVITRDSPDLPTYVASCECETELGRVTGTFEDAHAELRSRWAEHLVVEVASFIYDALLVSLDTVPS